MTRRVPFLALAPGADAAPVRAAIDRVLASGWFILGPELAAFESEFAEASGARHAVGVGTGTDAIALILRALGIGPGDEVITSSVSAAFSGLAIAMAGATPVFVDIDDERGTILPAAIDAAITPRTAAILPVHLYGQPADMAPIAEIAARRNLALVEDACQAHLATCDGRPVGTIGVAGAFSFYPTKNLGAAGDAGAIVTNDAALVARLKSLRNGGQSDRYHHPEFGVNSRLDELQAGVLRARLPFLQTWTARRREIAGLYRSSLTDTATRVPREFDAGHVYHLFPVRTEARDAFMRHLESCGIGSIVHYPIPLPHQGAFGTPTAHVPNAERLCTEVCSLPLHPSLSGDDAQAVIDAVRSWSPDRSTPSLATR